MKNEHPKKSQKVIVITNPELGWDCVVCVANSLKAAANYLEFKSVKDLKNDEQYVIFEKEIV